MNHGRRGSFRSHETELLPLLLVTTPITHITNIVEYIRCVYPVTPPR